MMRYWNYDPGFSVLGFVFQIFFWGLIIMLIVKFFKSSHHCCHNDEMEGVEADRSLDIVKERYAKGEIDKKEFEQLKKDLN